MAAMVYDSDMRTLNESELVYKISMMRAPLKTLSNNLRLDARKLLWRSLNSIHV